MFLMTLSLFTFVMSIGVVIKAIDLLAKGISLDIILQVFIYNMPYVMMFSIPMSTLTTALLLVGRLSMDGEITAMKASGLSIWQITSPIIVFSIILSFICVYLNSDLAPKSHFARRTTLTHVKSADPIHLLEEGHFIRDFPGLSIYIGGKDENNVKDIVMYEFGPHGVKQCIRAETGRLKMEEEQNALVVDLYEVRIDQPDENNPLDPSKTQSIKAQHIVKKLNFSELFNEKKIKKKVADMTLMELIHVIHDIKKHFPYLSEKERVRERLVMVVEANGRIVLSLSCFAFTLLGIPLGMKSRRRESSIGIGISLLLVIIFYFFIIIAEALVDYPAFRPDLISWIPVLCYELIGFVMIRRLN